MVLELARRARLMLDEDEREAARQEAERAAAERERKERQERERSERARLEQVRSVDEPVLMGAYPSLLTLTYLLASSIFNRLP
jgi:hypothetical protein